MTKPTNHIYRYTLSLIMAAFCVCLTHATPNTTLPATAKRPVTVLSANADSAYNAKNYTEAAELYMSIIREYGATTDVYYNLGNTYFRMGKTAQSVLSYERALKLDPSNSDARANLEYVNKTLEDRPEDNSSVLGKIHSGVIALMSPNAWAWTTFAIFILTLGFAGIYLFMANVTARKIGFFGAIIIFIVFIYAIVVAYQSATAIDNNDAAIVTAPSANLTSTPSAITDKNDKIVPVHEGTRLVIIDSVNTTGNNGTQLWYHVRVNNSTAACIDASNVERI